MRARAIANPAGGGGWLSAAIRRDPRRSGLLGILLVVLVVLWGRMLLGAHLPSAVNAANLIPMPQTSADAARNDSFPPSRTARSLSQWAQAPSPGLDRNLFSVPLEYYSQDPLHPPKPKHSQEQLAKSSTTEADQLRERQNLAENLRTAAANLTLEGTVLGANPRAWVNSLLVGIGQPIGDSGFRIAKIESRRIFIERDGMQIELSMK